MGLGAQGSLSEKEKNLIEFIRGLKFGEIIIKVQDGLPLVITTNCSMDELEAQIGGRSFDRLVEVCRFVLMDAESYRVLKATGKA